MRGQRVKTRFAVQIVVFVGVGCENSAMAMNWINLYRSVRIPPANYCQRYRPAAKFPQPVDSPTSHLGFRCIIREPHGSEPA